MALLALVAAAVGLTIALATGGGAKRLVPSGGNRSGTYDPLAYSTALQARFEQEAAAGESHIVYAKSPGGVIATARRTARWRPLIDRAAAAGGIDPGVLEGMVFLESAGRPDVIAGSDPADAAGLAQILAETGQNLLGMRVNLAASRRLTRQILRARRPARVRRLEAARRRVDDRFEPAKALQGAVRYLDIAKARFGRQDLAVTSYHMGIGNLEDVLRDYAGSAAGTPVGKLVRDDGLSYARVYFDSSPLRHPAAWNLLSRFGDDSSNYYWKVLAAEQIMRLYRTDPAELSRLSRLQTARASAEEVLHPEATTHRYADPAAIATDVDARLLIPLPDAPRRYGFRIDPLLGQFAARLHRRRTLYRHLRPEALALLVYMAAGTREIGGEATPLSVTSAVRDDRYQRLVAAANIEATRGYSLHTTGFAFDIRRAYSSRREAVAFQFMLDRLQAMNLIAWVREPQAIHVTVSSAARVLEPLLGARR